MHKGCNSAARETPSFTVTGMRKSGWMKNNTSHPLGARVSAKLDRRLFGYMLLSVQAKPSRSVVECRTSSLSLSLSLSLSSLSLSLSLSLSPSLARTHTHTHTHTCAARNAHTHTTSGPLFVGAYYLFHTHTQHYTHTHTHTHCTLADRPPHHNVHPRSNGPFNNFVGLTFCAHSRHPTSASAATCDFLKTKGFAEQDLSACSRLSAQS